MYHLLSLMIDCQWVLAQMTLPPCIRMGSGLTKWNLPMKNKIWIMIDWTHLKDNTKNRCYGISKDWYQAKRLKPKRGFAC